MNNTRRGFLASLLALIPFAGRTRGDVGPLKTLISTKTTPNISTIRIFNGAPFIGAAFIGNGVLVNNIQSYVAVNTSGTYDVTGVPGETVFVNALDFFYGEILQANITTFPARGTTRQFNLNYSNNIFTNIGTTTLLPN